MGNVRQRESCRPRNVNASGPSWRAATRPRLPLGGARGRDPVTGRRQPPDDRGPIPAGAGVGGHADRLVDGAGRGGEISKERDVRVGRAAPIPFVRRRSHAVDCIVRAKLDERRGYRHLYFRRHLRAAIPALEPLLKDPEPIVRGNAAAALRAIQKAKE